MTYHEQMTQLATEAFADHELAFGFSSIHGRWLIRRPKTRMYIAEIIVSLGSIIIHGDIELTKLSPFHSHRPPTERNHDALRWLAGQNVSSYFVEKAEHNGRYDYDAATAQAQCDAHCAEIDAEDPDSPHAAALRRVKWAEHTTWQAAQTAQYELGIDGPYAFGRVPAARLYYAQAALDRLVTLLELR